MGCCIGSDLVGREINVKMKQELEQNQGRQHLLLLGAGESGKSTLFKNLKRVHGEPLVEEARAIADTANTVRQSLVEFLVKLLVKSQALYELDKENNADCLVKEDDSLTVQHVQFLVKYQKNTFGEGKGVQRDDMLHLGEAIAYLWKLPSIQATFAKRCGLFSFPDNLEYFYNKVSDVMDPGYTPAEEDILKARVRTTGAVVYEYTEQGASFLITDVGGQRSERKKWVSQFDNVAAVIFVTALNHYNAVLFEDERKNAMHEALELFKEYANIPQFRQTELILFLNKKDLFEEQLRKFPLSVCFSTNAGWDGEEWTGENYKPIVDDEEEDMIHFGRCYSQAVEFIKDLFVKRNTVSSRVVSCHITCATDQNNVQRAFWDVQRMVIQSNLKHVGILS